MLAYWIITIPAILCYIFLCKGESYMELDAGVVALIVAIVGLIGTMIGNIIVNFKGWKASEKMIGNSRSNKTITAMLGNDGADRVSLSDEHKELKKELETTTNYLNMSFQEFQTRTENLIKPNNELLIRIDEREKNAEALRKMREDLLVPSQMAIKDSIDNLTAMSDNWQKNNAELILAKKENQELRLELVDKNNIIEQKNKEISILQKELSEVKEQLQQYGNQPSVDEVSFIGAEEGADELKSKR